MEGAEFQGFPALAQQQLWQKFGQTQWLLFSSGCWTRPYNFYLKLGHTHDTDGMTVGTNLFLSNVTKALSNPVVAESRKSDVQMQSISKVK